MSDDKATIKAVQQRMQQVRHDMGDEVDHLVESAKDITDWRKYVRANPWACVAAAAAVGFLIVPKRGPAMHLDDADLRELAKHSKLLMAQTVAPSRSIGRTLLSMVATATLRGVLGYVGQRISRANMEAAREPNSF